MAKKIVCHNHILGPQLVKNRLIPGITDLPDDILFDPWLNCHRVAVGVKELFHFRLRHAFENHCIGQFGIAARE